VAIRSKLSASGFWRFVILAGCAWIIDVGLTVLLVKLGVAVFVASWVGAGTAVLFVYFTSRAFVFGVNKFGTVKQLVIYAVWQLFAITMASVLVALIAGATKGLFAEWFDLRFMGPNEIAAAIGKVVVPPLVVVANFLFIRWLVGWGRTGPT
jgi:putative flippase GtrA